MKTMYGNANVFSQILLAIRNPTTKYEWHWRPARFAIPGTSQSTKKC